MKILLTYKDESLESKISNVVKILTDFLDRYEGKRPRKPEIKVSAFNYNYKPFQI